MNIPTDSDFVTEYKLNHVLFPFRHTFKYYELPVMGVGPEGRPFIRLCDHIDTNDFPAIWQELYSQKHLLRPYSKKIVVNGVIPKEFNYGVKSIDSFLLNPDKYLDWHYESDIKDMKILSEIKSYFYRKFGIPEPWENICHLREYTDNKNKSNPSNWLSHAHHFPLLTNFVNNLPFKVLGYAVFFISKANNPVTVHRDIWHKSHHKSNFVNLLFDQKPRNFFLFDSVSNKKIYLDQDCFAYMFNEADMHGVDAEEHSRYMLRVEGIFTDEFSEKLGLLKHDNYYEVFDWSYDKPKKWLKDNGLHIFQDTDL